MPRIEAPVALAITMLALAGCTTPGPEPQRPPARPFDLVVLHHPLLTGGMSEDEADRILADASRVLHDADGSDDVPCPILLRRAGALRRLPVAAPLIVRSGEDFRDLRALAGEARAVVIVNDILWCGAEGSTILGCAVIPDNVLVVRRWVRGIEGSVWAHEFGHNRGLDHVTDPVARTARLMNAFLDESSRQIRGNECGAFDGPTPAAAAPGQERFPTAAQADDVTIPTDVNAFVRQTPVGGFPFGAARRFGAEQVRGVLPLLFDPGAKSSWETVILLAGVAGGPDATATLLRFLMETPWDFGDPVLVSAKSRVLEALGYLANRHEDPVALRFLLRQSERGAWSRVAAGAPTVDQRIGVEQTLSTMTLTGLSVSGRPEAIRRLQALQASLRQTGRAQLPVGGMAAASGAAPDAAARESRTLIESIARAERARAGGIEAIRP